MLLLLATASASKGIAAGEESNHAKVTANFTRDATQATVKVQVNRLVTWIWIGGAVLTLGAALTLIPERAHQPVAIARRPAR